MYETKSKEQSPKNKAQAWLAHSKISLIIVKFIGKVKCATCGTHLWIYLDRNLIFLNIFV
jgi:hypothetical protein